ncbi:unnamed protein product [marine sediment metagenome]|uniref:Uncharacterized protein n=1 Tax=marine sediment metagenome TaxID=412755 RepID=X0XQ21_9ZZZZ
MKNANDSSNNVGGQEKTHQEEQKGAALLDGELLSGAEDLIDNPSDDKRRGKL